MKRYLLRRFWEAVAITVILSLLVLLLIPAVEEARSPYGPVGEMIPSVPPNETNRVRNAHGLSIVLPENWQLMERPLESQTLYADNRATRRRGCALLIIQRVGDSLSQDLLDFTATEFQGSRAYERMVVEREAVFLDKPAWSQYRTYFQHGGQWWYARYGIARECSTVPAMVRRYINTFHWDAAPPAESGT
jgi:hypothetical protein